jgi:hypothetical protein
VQVLEAETSSVLSHEIYMVECAEMGAHWLPRTRDVENRDVAGADVAGSIQNWISWLELRVEFHGGPTRALLPFSGIGAS